MLLSVAAVFSVSAYAQEKPKLKPVFSIGAMAAEYGTFGDVNSACTTQFSSGLRTVRQSSEAALIVSGPRFWVGSYPDDPEVELVRPYDTGIGGYLCHAEYYIRFRKWDGVKFVYGDPVKTVDSGVWIYPVCGPVFVVGSYPVNNVPAGAYCPEIEPPCEVCPDKPTTPYPFNVDTGVKRLNETDYAGGINQRLRVDRVYLSKSIIETPVGKWHFNSQKNIAFRDGNYALVANGSGGAHPFAKSGDNWIGAAHGKEILRPVTGADYSWEYIDSSNTVERYDSAGRLIAIVWNDAYTQLFTYYINNEKYPSSAPNCQFGAATDGNLQCVTETGGRQIAYEYDLAHKVRSIPMIAKVIDPAGSITSYQYDSAHRLVRVIQADSSKHYHYDEPNLSSRPLANALTGISEEISPGDVRRYATYAYDSSGNAKSSVHANGVDRYEGSKYWLNGSWMAVKIDPNGNRFEYQMVQENGMSLVRSLKRPVGVGSPLATSSTNLYDANANLISRTDFGGYTTVYTYDLSRNLETKRVEANGKPEARTTSTQWHAGLRIPVQIDEPLRRTIYTHDASGNVLTKTEQATTDTNGSQGAAATIVGVAKVWAYTYNNFGQVLTAKGPRTDINDLTSYVYDTQGNLRSVTNPAGHVTIMGNYDVHGRVGAITDPNGVVTQLTYHPRGWLLSRAVTADGVTEPTTYTYDGIGQMTQVTLPDNSIITYTYDDAHRLTKVSDHLGNSITYTLDNMGNRVKEEVKDTNGALSRQVTRVYDVLNRLKEVTGGAQ